MMLKLLAILLIGWHSRGALNDVFVAGDGVSVTTTPMMYHKKRFRVILIKKLEEAPKESFPLGDGEQS